MTDERKCTLCGGEGHHRADCRLRKRKVKVNAMSFAKLVKLLLVPLYNCQELADVTGLHYVTVLQYTRELHREGAAHIHHFEQDTRGRDSIRVYKLGPGKDAVRTRLTSVQRSERYRTKRRQALQMAALAGAATCTQQANGRLLYERTAVPA